LKAKHKICGDSKLSIEKRLERVMVVFNSSDFGVDADGQKSQLNRLKNSDFKNHEEFHDEIVALYDDILNN